MDNFISPVPYGSMKNVSFSKDMSLTSPVNSILVAPYRGVVVYNRDFDECSKGIKIKHYYDDKIVYSEFCNAGRNFVSHGDSVRQGQTIGQFSTEDITYSIKNDNDSKIDVPPFFRARPNEKPVSSYNNRETEKETDVKPASKEKEKNNKQKKDKNQSPFDDVDNPFMSLLLSPLGAVGSVLGKPKSDFRAPVREEIDRIKKIIK